MAPNITLTFFFFFSKLEQLPIVYIPMKIYSIKYQDKWGRNNYKKVVKEFKKSPLNNRGYSFFR